VLFNSENFPSLSGSAPPEAYRALMRKAQLLTLTDGEVLFAERTVLDALYLVRSGFARVTRSFGEATRVLSYLSEGTLLAAQGIVYREPAHAYGVNAAGRLEVLRIDISDVYGLMMEHPTLGQALIDAAQSEDVARSRELSPPIQGVAGGPTHMAPLNREALVDAGLAKGREVLVIDQTKCTNCQACTEACARRHGHGRLELRGLQLDHLLFPTACRHCEDPVCLLCSVNGIVRRPSGEISVIEDNCVGCGACASRCPYGNIKMGDADHSFRDEPFDVWAFLGFRRKGTVDRETSSSSMKKAHKCDLCADFADYACVNACPTGAAFRSDLSEVVSATDGGIGLKGRGH
jgi:Fe-S-cluster-containing dehydrogenase component